MAKGGFVLFGIGAVIFIIGFSLFMSVFFALGARDIWQWDSSAFPKGMGPTLTGHGQSMTLFQRGIVGFILIALGAIMIKIGLGLGLFGNIENIMAWMENLFSKKTTPELPKDSLPADKLCPACGKPPAPDSHFCNHCGAKIE